MNADPDREKVERADAVVRESEESVIEDPTVFVKGAALGALTLVALAKLARSRSQSAGVQSFADHIVANQQALRKGLQTVAGRKRLDVPATMVFSDEQMLATAPADPGAEFDGWFALHAHTEHVRAIALFEAATRMKDADLAAFAKRTLPVLEADRKLASALTGA